MSYIAYIIRHGARKPIGYLPGTKDYGWGPAVKRPRRFRTVAQAERECGMFAIAGDIEIHEAAPNA